MNIIDMCLCYMQVNELRTRVTTYEENSADKTVVQRLENKVRDLETRLDLETANKHRLEVHILSWLCTKIDVQYWLYNAYFTKIYFSLRF